MEKRQSVKWEGRGGRSLLCLHLVLSSVLVFIRPVSIFPLKHKAFLLLLLLLLLLFPLLLLAMYTRSCSRMSCSSTSSSSCSTAFSRCYGTPLFFFSQRVQVASFPRPRRAAHILGYAFVPAPRNQSEISSPHTTLNSISRAELIEAALNTSTSPQDDDVRLFNISKTNFSNERPAPPRVNSEQLNTKTLALNV